MHHIRFGAFSLQLPEGQLQKGHQQLSLRPKSMTVLHYLLNNRDRYVSEIEILTTCWAGLKVDNSAVKGGIRDIRKALADDATAPQFIGHQPRQGYRFIAPVAFIGTDEILQHHGRRAVLSALPSSPPRGAARPRAGSSHASCCVCEGGAGR